MRINRKDAKLLLYTGGILTLVLVYFLVFKPVQEDNRLLMAENSRLAEELNRREEHAQNMEFYREEIRSMQAEIKGALSAFPAAIREETVIMYADALERQSDMEIAGVNIGLPSQIYELGQGAAVFDEEGNQFPVSTGVYLHQTQAVYTFTVSYDDFKKTMNSVLNQKELRNVENVILSFDSASGKLVGSMAVNLFSVSGTEKTYQDPDVPGMSLGTGNIFGTVTSQPQD